jgi:N-acetylmuramic acid 6-phosphate etherase
VLNLEQRMTEEQNPRSRELDLKGTEEILSLMNQEDRRVPLAVAEQLPNIAAAVDRITFAIKAGGKVFYVGAGTSGRIAAQDAAECPPTFGASPDLFQVVMAGGPDALSRSVEGAEDSADDGYVDLMSRQPTPRDVVVGIAASGETPYVIGGLSAAREVGCSRIALVCNPGSELERLADVTICPVVGPEVLTGSTRLKAGTAQKLVLNMISTAVMVRLGKVYDNYMVEMVASNNKLLVRSRRIVEGACGVGPADAERLIQEAHGNLKVALVMGKTGTDSQTSADALARADGVVRKAISSLLGTDT